MFGRDASFEKALRGFAPRPPDLTGESRAALSASANYSGTFLNSSGVVARKPESKRKVWEGAQVEIGPYFRMPKGFLSSGIGAALGPACIAVYAALCFHLNSSRERERNTVAVSDRALASDTGVSERNMRNIRTKLVEAKIVSVAHKPGQSHRYTLHVVPFDRVKIDDRPRRKRKPRAFHAITQSSAA